MSAGIAFELGPRRGGYQPRRPAFVYSFHRSFQMMEYCVVGKYSRGLLLALPNSSGQTSYHTQNKTCFSDQTCRMDHASGCERTRPSIGRGAPATVTVSVGETPTRLHSVGSVGSNGLRQTTA